MADLSGTHNDAQAKPCRNDEASAGHPAAACTATVLLFLGTLLIGTNYPRHVTWPLAVNEDRIRCVRSGIDPNTATWFELAQLPGIGEALARRIVEFRDAQAAASNTTRAAMVFSRPADLTRVKGIGNKTLLRLGPHLCLPPPQSAH